VDRNLPHQFLDAEEVVRTIDRLALRIAERFPSSNLSRVCRQLLTVAKQAKARSARIARPVWSLRLFTLLLVLLILGGSAATVAFLELPSRGLNLVEFIQLLEAAINDLVLIGAAVFFLFTLETRVKRRRALAAIHELRSIAHIIDMHQLTKDPERILYRGRETASSPREEMTMFELNRYLDYCTEMLSLTGKIAAVHVQSFEDSVALASANEVESLCTGLSRKIWQKIMVLHSLSGDREPVRTPAQKGPLPSAK
jgi:hypothetical protein